MSLIRVGGREEGGFPYNNAGLIIIIGAHKISCDPYS